MLGNQQVKPGRAPRRVSTAHQAASMPSTFSRHAKAYVPPPLRTGWKKKRLAVMRPSN